MQQAGSGMSSGVRALEFTIAVAAALLAADTIHAMLAPIWTPLRLLFGF